MPGDSWWKQIQSLLFQTPGFKKFEDAYAWSEDSKANHLIEAIKTHRRQYTGLIVACHFPGTFWKLQDWLDQAGIAYRIHEPPIDPWEHLATETSTTDEVTLVWCQAWVPTVPSRPRISAKASWGVLVAERHPDPERDEALEAYLRQAPVAVRLGYFLSFADPCVRLAVTPVVLDLIRQVGMKPDEMISSRLATKQLRQVLKRYRRQCAAVQDAETVEEWLALNYQVALNSPEERFSPDSLGGAVNRRPAVSEDNDEDDDED